MSWEAVTLGDISANIQTGPFGSQLHQSDYSTEGTPVVMPKDLVNGHISEATIARVSNDHVERLNRHKIEIGDILGILSAYDTLIENNQKQIKLLEETAQRLYKEWFVDLRFLGYETTPVLDGVPEGWQRYYRKLFINLCQ